MERIKLCPACNEENPISEIVCRVCMTNLSSISPSPKGERKLTQEAEPVAPDGAVEPSSPSVLTLMRFDGRPVPVADGSELGREGEYRELLCDVKTISRRHARITRNAESWQIQDLESTNGTWVNGKRLAPGRACPLNVGDTLALSLSCEFKVVV